MRGYAALVCGLGLGLVEPVVADGLGQAIDLAAFDAAAAGPADILADDLQEISATQGIPTLITPYVSGIVGASFGSLATSGQLPFSASAIDLAGSANQALLTGGGAVGMAIARPGGQLRMEVEGRARGPLTGQEQFEIDGMPLPFAPSDVSLTGGWSTTTNFWRDLDINDRFGTYLGGGFGVGGYQLRSITPDPFNVFVGEGTLTMFAWQAGTGITYAWSERVTLDLGYRFFAMTPGRAAYFNRNPAAPNPIPLGSYASAFSASELLLSVRIYEPFRGLIR